jgi:hypothetical protein
VTKSAVFLDTSFILALENRDDPLHERAKHLDRVLLQQGSTLLLHWGILLEIGDGYSVSADAKKGGNSSKRFRTREVFESSL